jgi:hypothetical protein
MGIVIRENEEDGKRYFITPFLPNWYFFSNDMTVKYAPLSHFGGRLLVAHLFHGTIAHSICC